MRGSSAVRVEVLFPGNTRYLPAIRELVREALLAEGGHPSVDGVSEILLAVQEACVNAIRHGHRGDATRPVGLTVVNHPDRIEIRIRDDGEGFDMPEEVRFSSNPTAESGRGLAIIQAVMDEVSVATDGVSTVLSLVKRKGIR